MPAGSSQDESSTQDDPAPRAGRPVPASRLPTALRRLHPQLESDSLATTPQGAVEGYFPSSEAASTSQTPSNERLGQHFFARPDSEPAAHPRNLASKGGLRQLRESLSAHNDCSHRHVRSSTNAEEGIALPDHVRDFGNGKKSGIPTPPRLQTDSVALPVAGNASEFTGRAAIGPNHHPKAGSIVAPEFHRAFPSAGSTLGFEKTERGASRAISSKPQLPGTASVTGRTKPKPFSLAGTQQPSSAARQRHSSSGPPLGVAIPRPRPRDGPSWAGKARRKPLYSLGKPLPTHEEVQAQKEWEEQMKRIKERYPDAEPPAPPPLPSQQESSGVMAADGLQLDREQLQDVIRTVIAEFRSYADGKLDLGTARGFSTGGDQLRPRRLSFFDPHSMPGSQKAMVSGPSDENDGGSQVATIDSIVVEDEDDDPLPEASTPYRARPPRLPSKVRQKAKDRTSSGSVRRSAFADEGRREEQELAHVAREAEAERDEAKPNKPQPALPSKPRKRRSRSSDSTIAGEVGSKASAESSPRHRRPSQASRILSRDHEQDGSWSDDAQGPHQVSVQSAEDEENQQQDDFPNPLARFRSKIREPAAEFLGAMALGIIGIGASMQTGLLSNPSISTDGQGTLSASVNIGQPLAWGVGVAVSIYIAGGISGGHISPVITIVLWLFRGFRKRNS